MRAQGLVSIPFTDSLSLSGGYLSPTDVASDPSESNGFSTVHSALPTWSWMLMTGLNWAYPTFTPTLPVMMLISREARAVACSRTFMKLQLQAIPMECKRASS